MSKKTKYKQCVLEIVDQENKTTYTAYIPSDKAILWKNLIIEDQNIKVLEVSDLEVEMTLEEVSVLQRSFWTWREVTDI